MTRLSIRLVVLVSSKIPDWRSKLTIRYRDLGSSITRDAKVIYLIPDYRPRRVERFRTFNGRNQE